MRSHDLNRLLDEPVFTAGFFSYWLWKYLFDRHAILRRIADQSAAATVFIVAIAATPIATILTHRNCRECLVDFTSLKTTDPLCPGMQIMGNADPDMGWLTYAPPSRPQKSLAPTPSPIFVVDAGRSVFALSASRHHNMDNVWAVVLLPGLV